MMQASAQTNFGALSALPFLFSLMGFAGLFFVTSLSVVIAEREEVETTRSVDQQREQAALAHAQDFQAWKERLTAIQAEIAKASMAKRGDAALAQLRQEWRQISTTVEESQKKLGLLQHQKAELQNRLEELQALQENAARLRLSRKDLEAKISQLQAEIASLQGEANTVRRKVEEIDQVQVKDLVPGGQRRPAVFVECNAQGAWIMPERRLLEPTVPPAAREALLNKASSKRYGYIVFFIRPDGYTAFKRYREVVETHNKSSSTVLEYGYEPVNADWKLVYPTE